MNMNALMAQAKKLHGDLEKTTKEIESENFTFENDYIFVKATGNNNITCVKIKDKSILEDEEMFEDIVTVAINNVLSKIKKEKENKLGKYAGGLGGLF